MSHERDGLGGLLPVLATVQAVAATVLVTGAGLQAAEAAGQVAASAVLASAVAWVAGSLAGRVEVRAQAALASVLASLVPPAYLFCARAFDTPLVAASFCARCETALVELPVLAPTTMLAAAALGGLAAGAVLSAGAHARTHRWLDRMALGLAGASVVLWAIAGVRAVRPEPRRYLESLPVVAELPAITGAPARIEAGLPWTWDPSAVHEAHVDGTLVSRVCNAHVCGLSIGRPPPGSGLWGEHVATVYADRPVRLRRDARLDLWIAEQEGVRRAVRGGEAVRLDARDVAAVAGPPRPWWLASALGLLGVGWALGTGRSIDRGRLRLEAGLPGTVRDDGWLELDGMPARRTAGSAPPGPAVLLAGAAGSAAYRSGTDRGHVLVSGERAVLLDAARTSASAHRLLAIAFALLAAAPLAAAAGAGLVSPF